MRRPLKAALLSGLVFPGAGHFYLKRHFSGLVLAGVGVVSFYILLSHAVSIALVLSQRILNGEVTAKLTNIRVLIAEQRSLEETQLVSLATSVFVVVWLVSIVDSFRIASNQKQQA